MICFHEVGEVESSYDSLIFDLIIGGLEAESKGVFSIYPVWRGQDQPYTASLGVSGPVDGKSPDGEVGANWVASVDCAGVNSMMKSAKICPFTIVLGLYLVSNSLSSIAHFISLAEVSGLCSIFFIRYSIGTSTV